MKKIYRIKYFALIFPLTLSPFLIGEPTQQISQRNEDQVVEQDPTVYKVLPHNFVTTPLHELVAKQFDDKEEKLAKIKELLDQGADINAQNENHRTALWLVTFYGGDNIDLIKLLLQYHADITIPDIFNVTPLHNLVNRNDTQAAALLLDVAAKSNTFEKMMTFKNDAQETPLTITKTPEMDETLLSGELLYESLLSENEG